MNILWCNGEWVDGGELSVSAKDRGLLHGLGVFETILAVDGRPIFAERHLERFENAAVHLGWKVSVEGLVDAMAELLVKNQMHQERARIRLAITAGEGALNDLRLGADAMIWMQCSPVGFPPEQQHVMVTEWKRNEKSPLVGLKSASYAENLLALQDANQQGFDEVLFFNTADELCEGAMSNVFLVKDGKLMTPNLSSGCLPGVTRAVVIDLAAELGLSPKECSLRRSDLDQADELFMTSSTKGVVPVMLLGDRELHLGAVTSQLRVAWEKKIAR